MYPTKELKLKRLLMLRVGETTEKQKPSHSVDGIGRNNDSEKKSFYYLLNLNIYTQMTQLFYWVYTTGTYST